MPGPPAMGFVDQELNREVDTATNLSTEGRPVLDQAPRRVSVKLSNGQTGPLGPLAMQIVLAIRIAVKENEERQENV